MKDDAQSEVGETDPPLFYAGFNDVLREEIDLIQRRWRQRVSSETVDRDNLTGLALSGGGIRSASFAMGAIQQLHNAGVIERLHYMSSVSGGGYTGSSLTWFLTRGDPSQNPFPFTGGEAAGVRLGRQEDVNPETPKSAAEKEKNKTPLSRIAGRQLVEFIRQRSSYLLPANLGLLSALTVVLRSVLTSLAGYFILFVFVALTLLGVVAVPASLPGLLLQWSGLLAALLGVTMLGYSVFAPLPRSTSGYRARRVTQLVGGLLLALVILTLVLSAWLLVSLDPRNLTGWLAFLAVPESSSAAAGGAGLGALGVLGGLATRALARATGGVWLRLLLPVLPALSLFLLVTGLGVGAFAFADWLRSLKGWTAEGAFVAAGLVYLVCTNLNLTGLNRFYRDRLMECFLPDIDDVVQDQPSQPSEADGAPLYKMYPPGHRGPFHIINTNVILFEAERARNRGRKGDAFFLTPLYSGSDATGFVATRHWLPTKGWLLRPIGPMTLPTAMGVSGAAVNPNTGPGGGTAITQNLFVSAVLTMLNLRLGYWVPSPQLHRNKAGDIVYRNSHRLPPNHLWPGITHGLLGLNRSERSRWLELTDGGHFDNTGVYELVRRRVKSIYFIDGGEDPDVTFANFASMAERIFIDFNVTMTFPEPEHSFARLMSGSAPDADVLTKRFNLAEKGFAVADIHYPQIKEKGDPDYRAAIEGRLYIVKATMTADLPAALYAYKADHPAFPSESTLDQFFSEQQFEAYRTLGFTLTRQLTDHLRPPEAPRPNLN